MTFNGPTNRNFAAVDTLWLSLVDDSSGTVYDVAHFGSIRVHEDPDDPNDDWVNTKCWLYMDGKELRDSEACKVP